MENVNKPQKSKDIFKDLDINKLHLTVGNQLKEFEALQKNLQSVKLKYDEMLKRRERILVKKLVFNAYLTFRNR